MRLAVLLLSLSTLAAAECVPFTKAGDHIGETTCVSGKVVGVSYSKSGVFFLNFCQDYRGCSFSVVVFARDIRDVGDVRALEGKEIEIRGKIKSYKGQPEIILRDRSQLRGEVAKLPPLPKNFDVERKGNYSAGTYKSSKRSTNSQNKGDGRQRDPIEEE